MNCNVFFSMVKSYELSGQFSLEIVRNQNQVYYKLILYFPFSFIGKKKYYSYGDPANKRSMI